MVILGREYQKCKRILIIEFLNLMRSQQKTLKILGLRQEGFKNIGYANHISDKGFISKIYKELYIYVYIYHMAHFKYIYMYIIQLNSKIKGK